MDKRVFFDTIGRSLFNGRLSLSRRDGIETKLSAFDVYGITDERWRAYMLATSYHETGGTMQPVEETGKGKGRPYGEKRKQDGTVYTYPDRLYFGRGDVQLTWYENYERMGKLLGYPLLTHPELALEPDISARILVEGMTRGSSNRGDFTGVSLEDYFNDHTDDPVNARRIVNGLDCARRIAEYHRKFLEALKIAFVAFVAVLLLPSGLAGCKPGRVVTERIVTRTDSSAVQMLSDSLYRKEAQIAFLQADVKRARAENIRLRSETRRYEIQYDTTAPVDTVTGKQRVLREIITSTGIRYGKVTEEAEERHEEMFAARENFAVEDRNRVLTVDKQTREDRALKEKTTTLRFNYKLFLAGVVAGMVIGVGMMRLLKGI
ncbi:glycoside hydrolase family 19 protein [Proteiniphilum acetatigenes]|uniref:glycoside hydrolase family 19 protein n=1 Tax=Proteiniphilum acetatigenes TaxID=294710 RepID=UPI000371B207|nr:glycoside hydrolase family 19 protein [Proteiniphilum acetatigenes]